MAGSGHLSVFAVGWHLPVYRQGVGVLELESDTLVWRQKWRSLFSLFGLAPGWAPDEVLIPLRDITRVALRQRLISPEFVVIDTVQGEFTFKLGIALSLRANRSWTRELSSVLQDSGIVAELEVPRPPVVKLLVAGSLVTTATAMTLGLTAWFNGVDPLSSEVVIPSAGTALLALIGYS